MSGRFAGLLSLVAALLPAALGLADATATHQGDIFILENQHMRVEVDAAAGARIRSWRLKPSGREMIALWKGAGEIGGALDDRGFFTSARYDASVTQPGPGAAVLRFEARHSSGLGVVRQMTLPDDSPALRVNWEWRNGTQTPQRLFVRNFLLPGTQPQTEQHLYWVNAAEGPVAADPTAAGYHVATTPEYAALWDALTGDGIAVYAPGVDKFYFWRQSALNPTFEWLHEDIPAGTNLLTEAVFITVADQTQAPDWAGLVQEYSGGVRARRLVDLPGWVDEATLFGVADAERERGFWVSVGADEVKQRLPEPLEIDLPLGADRSAGITLNVVAGFSAPISVDIPDEWAGKVKAFWQTAGEDRNELLPLPQGELAFAPGARETLWLNVASEGKPAGDYTIPIAVHVGDHVVDVNLDLTIWPVTIDTPRPFHMRGYSGGFPVWTGGYEVTPEKLATLEAILTAYEDMGGDVLDWACAWSRLLEHVKIAGTNDIITEVARSHPERIDLNALPRLDFSYYDPWFDAALAHGVNRVETYMQSPSDSQIGWRLLTPAVGAGRAEVGSPEAERVLVWLYAEMRRHFEQKGFQGFFGKISDEISPEHIPGYIATARFVREAGWRPFTTITGMIPRSAEHINAMNPHCDEWQLGFGSKDHFLGLLRDKYVLTDESIKLEGKWGRYGNGGAVETWGLRVFGEGSATGIQAATVEGFELLEDGRVLEVLGGSPWGNKQRGVVITGGGLKAWLYVSPFDGTDPATHAYELRLKLRTQAPEGKPPAAIDESDEVWCYGGGSRPYRGSYAGGYGYPIMTLQHGFAGYGQWAFYHWNKTERVIWVDERTNAVTVSPAYCGYRDGWHDALIYSQLIQTVGREAFDGIVGPADTAILKVGSRSSEVYTFTTVLNLSDPVALNAARREALRTLAGR